MRHWSDTNTDTLIEPEPEQDQCVPGAHAIVEAYMNRLDKNVLPLLKPYLLRLMYSEGLPKLVDVR